jgi:hypothetical protein
VALAAVVDRRSEDALLAQLRDHLVDGFARETASHVPAVLESLEHQLRETQDRDNWRPLRDGIALLESVRPVLADSVARHARERFDARLGTGTARPVASIPLSALSLVADDAIQEEIELGHVTRHLVAHAGETLSALTRRLASVLRVPGLADDHNPVFPSVLANGLLDTLHEAPQEAPARIAVLIAFGPALSAATAALYRDANELLRARGILPDIDADTGPAALQGTSSPERERSAESTDSTAEDDAGPHKASAGGNVTGAPGAAVPTGTGAGSGPDLAGQLSQLFAAAEARQAAMAPHAAPGVSPPAAPGMVSIQVRPELLEALRALEARIAPEPSLAGLQHMAFPDAAARPAPGTQTVQDARKELGDAMTPADGVVADIVAAMFERLLADRRLSDPIKVQVGRLQLPVFKAVMQDRSFLADGAHPIRVLFDAFAELAACDDLARVEHRAPHEWAAVVVEDLLAAGGAPGAYAAAVQRLAEALERFHEAAVASDATVRLVRSHEGHLVAVQDATIEVTRRLAAGHLPATVADFLQRAWRDVLVHDLDHGGATTAEWKADLATLDDLLASLAPHDSREERSQMVSTLPDLLRRLHESFARAGIDRELAIRTFEGLEHAHAELARAPAHSPAPAPVASGDDAAAPPLLSAIAPALDWLQCGAWIELVDDDLARHRCRLAWASARSGICVLTEFETGKSLAMAFATLVARRDAGTALVVDGPGLAASAIASAVQDVATLVE